jgi:hypothetical protein
LELPGVPLMRELAFLNRVTHPNIVRFFGYYNDPKGLVALVLEHCDYALDTIDPYAGVIMQMVNPFKVASDVALALNHMHSYSCVHRGRQLYSAVFLTAFSSISLFLRIHVHFACVCVQHFSIRV